MVGGRVWWTAARVTDGQKIAAGRARTSCKSEQNVVRKAERARGVWGASIRADLGLIHDEQTRFVNCI